MDLSQIKTDFTEDETVRLRFYVKNGCPGLESLSKDEAKITSMFSLYMSGKTYNEIAEITKAKIDEVLFMSAKMKWYEKRMNYLEDIQKDMANKIRDTRLRSLNFITSLINFHHEQIGSKIDKYLATKDEKIVETIDLKALTHYFKSIEVLEKIMNPSNVGPKSGGTTININSESTVKQVDDKTLEITPGKTGDVLRALAKMKEEKSEKK
jgi:hypothetical protein